MKIYIAAHDKELARLFSTALVERGHKITSRWIYSDKGISSEQAEIDLCDIDDCDVLVSLATFDNVPGGKHVELGYAMALRKRIIHWGRTENIFHLHPAIKRAAKINDIFTMLTTEG